jgi:hypothetical protein
MSDQVSLIRLIAELDQVLAQAEDRLAEEPTTTLKVTFSAAIVDGLRAALADVECQLACLSKSRDDRYASSHRHCIGSRPGELDLSGEEIIINEFLAAPDAELTLRNVVNEMQPRLSNAQ